MKIAVLIIVILLLVQTVAARESSGLISPESSLYPLKVWIERFSLNLVFNQSEKAERMLDLAEERLDEAEKMENNSRAFERAMEEYASQLEELQDIAGKENFSTAENIRTSIKEKIEAHKNRTEALRVSGRVSIVQQSIIEAGSSSGGSSINVSAVNGNISVHTEGGNATIIRDGSNVTVISVTNNSRQMVVVRSSQNASSVVQSSSVAGKN